MPRYNTVETGQDSRPDEALPFNVNFRINFMCLWGLLPNTSILQKYPECCHKSNNFFLNRI